MELAGFGEKAPCFVQLGALVQRAQCRSANRAGLAVLVFSSLPLWGKAVLSLPLAGDFPAPGAPWSSPGLCLLCAAGNFCQELPPGTALLPARCCSPRVLHHPAPILLCSSLRPTDSSGRAQPGLSPSFHFCTTAYKRSDALNCKTANGPGEPRDTIFMGSLWDLRSVCQDISAHELANLLQRPPSPHA